MEIPTVKKDHLPDMAALFVQNLKQLRSKVPVLPDLMEDTARISGMLEGLHKKCAGVVALDGGKVIGYMLWFLVDEFRNTDRRAAYCPEWGHATIAASKPEIYRAMYRAAATRWAEAGCRCHCISLLAHDRQAQDVWFWNGFGLLVVDAIRSVSLLDVPAPGGITIRRASPDDVGAISILEVEHAEHYTQAPVLMDAYEPRGISALTQSMSEPKNSIWLALDGNLYAGYMRFVVGNEDSLAVVRAPDGFANTGVYIRPQYRGRKIAVAMLNAAMQHYADQGYKRVSVDFESFNPEAAAFWPKYFELVGLSVMRVPER